jgi:hypothetical protein
MNQISQQPGMMLGMQGMTMGQQRGMIPGQPGIMPCQSTGSSGQQVGMMPGAFGTQFGTQSQACSPQIMMPGVGQTAGQCGQCVQPFGNTLTPPPTLPLQHCVSPSTPQLQLLGSNQFGRVSGTGMNTCDPSAIQREIQNVERELELERSRQQNQMFGSSRTVAEPDRQPEFSRQQGGIPYGGFNGYDDDSDSDNDWWNQPDRYTPVGMHGTGFGSSVGMPGRGQHSTMGLTQQNWSQPGAMQQCISGTQWSQSGAAQFQQACGAFGPQTQPFGVM